MDQSNSESGLAGLHSAIFGQMVAGHGHMVLTFLGRVPNPQSGRHETPRLEAAELFIAQLEMLQTKTRGNLGTGEAELLTSTLNKCRMAFIEEVQKLPDPDAEPPSSDPIGAP